MRIHVGPQPQRVVGHALTTGHIGPGEVFIAEALAQLPGKVIRPCVGSRFTFGAQGA